MENIKTDVLVIGSGAAGIRAALAAYAENVDVVMIAKGRTTECGSTFSSFSGGWGFQALVGNERTDKNLNDFYNDIVNAGLGMCDERLVRILVEESGHCMENLISFGIRFKRDDKGNYIRLKGCFSKYERAFITECKQNINESFLSIIKRTSVRIIRGYVIDLVVSEGVCNGVIALTGKYHLIKIHSKATVLACGGGAGIFKNHFVSDDEIGDGYAMAARAGAKLTNLEYIQFMLGLKTKDSFSFLPLNELSEQGKMTDSRGIDLFEMSGFDHKTVVKAASAREKHYPFSCRDHSANIDIAVAGFQKTGNNEVFWDRSYDTDNPVRVAHFSHAFNGGIKINEKAESSVQGLFAAGEASAGPHGADRIGGCMMTATQVFGKRAGIYAAKYACKRGNNFFPETKFEKWIKQAKISENSYDLMPLSELEDMIKRTLSKHVMVIRTDKGLQLCKRNLDDYEKQLEQINTNDIICLKKYFELKSMISTGKLVTQSAIERKKSNGSHFREDFDNVQLLILNLPACADR